MNRSADEQNRVGQERHDEVLRRFAETDDRAVDTVQRVSRLEALVDTISQEITKIRERWHNRFNDLQKSMGDHSLITRLDLKTAIAIYVSGAASLMGILKIMGKM